MPRSKLVIASLVAQKFGQHLKKLRDKRKLSQYKLAAKIKMHPMMINHYEKGRRQPTLGSIIRLAEGLGVPPADLLKYEK
jgi:transcriptional regulator with XRE-family HTH domain